jgi:TrmH family RNA methyltransferase
VSRPQVITSAQKPQSKFLRSLKNAKDRRLAGVFTVEGEKLSAEVFPPFRVRTVVLAESLAEKGVVPSVVRHYPDAERLVASDRLFESLCDTKTPQGVLAVVEYRRQSCADWLFSERERSGKVPLVAALENLQDPGNVGTIIRTADAAGATGVIVSAGTADPFSPKTLRASMGSVFHLPVSVEPDFLSTVRRLSEAGYQVAAAHLEGSRSLYEIDFSVPTVILIGNEGNGLSREVTDLAGCRMRIPQPGKAESLSAGVAASIILYEALRQRMGGSGVCI